MIKLDLQRFADGFTASGAAPAQSAGADTGAAASPTQSAYPQPQSARLPDGRSLVSADLSPGEASATGGRQAPQGEGLNGQGAGQPSFEELIQGQYRQEYEQRVGERIQHAIQDRFKNQQNYRQQAEAAQPILAALGQKFGLNPTDVAGITAKLNEDAYAEEANQKGVPVDVIRNEHQLRDQVARQEAQLNQVRQERQFQQHFAALQQQAAEFAREMPGFDLMREVRQNQDFAKWTSPEYGMSVRQAYYASHGPQMQAQGMQYAARQAAVSIGQSVAAGASRPQENGMGTPGAAPIAFDPRNMTPQQRAEYRDRLHRGQGIPVY